MKTFSLFLALSVAALAACGGGIVVEPIGDGDDGEKSSSEPKVPGPEGDDDGAPAPKAPMAPFTAVVETTDVSILYPMPAEGASNAFVRPVDAGDHGVLFPAAAFASIVKNDRLDQTLSAPTTGYADLALIGVRLDPCSARQGPARCTTEVRAVFQPIYTKSAVSEDGDKTLGAAANDGAVHVIYDLAEAELVILMKQILTLKRANGNLASKTLEPHPILSSQGLDGAFATGLKAILLEHLGADRIARVTVFDHNLDPDSDGWTFSTFDRDGKLTAKKIPTLTLEAQTVGGSRAVAGPLKDTTAFTFNEAAVSDKIEALLRDRPGPNEPEVTTKITPAYEAALRIQNPNLHNAETVDCASCHLAEGARLVGEAVYGLTSPLAFTHARSLAYRSERLSITNLHAFGYLHRKVSIMQRTANESVLAAEAMEQKVK